MRVDFLKGSDLINNPRLDDFIHSELGYDGMRDDLFKLISEFTNLVSFEYECNQYNVMFDGSSQTVTIRDAVHEEHSIPKYFQRISMSAEDFLKLLSDVCKKYP